MTDEQESEFVVSLREGIKRAEQVKGALSEIKVLLGELEDAIKQVTSGAILVSLASPRRTPAGQFLGVLEFFGQFEVDDLDSEDREAEDLEVLARVDADGSGRHASTRKLCRIRLSERGYPVYVDGDACHDKVGLKTVLGEVLSRATTGRKLDALQRLVPNAEPQEPDSESAQ